ncbi:retron St85 family effector protein [Clostridium sp. SHJSY1]|uniref:retron St85 family effector protein n=1 Tax=Clostridium sp. SHJSY1 TaxID=2942483 RepID=UPI002874EBAC|nr:retron St85 family effector protein [Clostridium sp. SHJSY1]MDS0527611.1 retron St85 family effector protein [Clostridium sp. SHJSY1]
MSILYSKSIESIIDKLSYCKRKNKFVSCKIPKFVFICGKQIINESGDVIDSNQLNENKNKRQFLIDKLSSRTLICTISEKIYDSSSMVDTLTFEEILAELSEDIIIIIESPGTICELGAFTVNNKFFKKLIVINDVKYKDDKSFINEGPIRKIKMNDEERYILVNDEYDLFKSNLQVNESIKSIKEKEIIITPNNNYKKLDLKNLIYELLNIIELFEPITTHELFHIYKRIKEFPGYDIKNREKHKINSSNKIIKLMENMDLVDIKGEYIKKKGDYTYYNSLFNISKEKCNEVRGKILYEMRKNYPERLWGDGSDDIRINE